VRREVFVKRLFTLLAVLALLVAGGFLWFQLATANRINAANYERIQAGMSLAEVEAILGEPAAKEEEQGQGWVMRGWGGDGVFVFR
jgi:hypothetical protein